MPKASATPANSGESVGQDGDVPASEGTQERAVAQYLGDMIGQLESMARAAKLDLLVYLLSMAREEAEAHARFGPGAPEA